MDDQAESSRRAFPMTPPPPPPPSPAIPEDYSSDAICWADSDNYSSSTRHTDFLSLWLSSYTAQLPHPEAEEEPVAHVPTLLNPNLESSLPDLVDWNTTSVAVKQGPVTEPLWVQLHAPAAGKEEDQTEAQSHGAQSPKPSISPLASGIESPKATMLSLALGIESPEASMLLPALGNQFLEASVSLLAPGIEPPPSSFEIQSPLEASISPLTGGTQPPQTYSEEETPQVSLSPLALGVQSSILPPAHGIQFPQASISPQISPLALKMQSSQTSVESQSAPATFSSPPSIPCTLSMAPLMEIFPPSRSPVPECRSWSEFSGTPPPAWRHLLLPHSASSNWSSPSSHPSHQADHFVPTANTGYLQEVVAGYVPVIFSTPDASANSYAGFDPANRPSWSQAMAQRGNWTPSQPWIGNGEDMELPIPQRPQFSLPPAAATMSEPPLVLANFGSSVANMPNTNAGGDVHAEDHQRVQTGKSKLAVRTDSKLIFKK